MTPVLPSRTILHSGMSQANLQSNKTVSWLEQEDALKIIFTYQAACVPTFEFTVTYTAHFDGKLGVCINYVGVSGMPDMPVLAFGLQDEKTALQFPVLRTRS